MWRLRLIDLLTYSWPFIDIYLHCLDDRKYGLQKYLLNIFIWLSEWGGVPILVTGSGSIWPLSDTDETYSQVIKLLLSSSSSTEAGLSQ
jgi:hypothetical protein